MAELSIRILLWNRAINTPIIRFTCQASTLDVQSQLIIDYTLGHSQQKRTIIIKLSQIMHGQDCAIDAIHVMLDVRCSPRIEEEAAGHHNNCTKESSHTHGLMIWHALFMLFMWLSIDCSSKSFSTCNASPS